MAKQSVWVLYVDKNKAMATFSSRGPTDASDFTGPKPDLVALGIEIVAPLSREASFDPVCEYPEYTALSGASTSTQVVSGISALHLSYGWSEMKWERAL